MHDRKAPVQELSGRPLVSVVIPCRNELEFVDSCLASVFAFPRQNGGFEVIVVDGMSEDGTRDRLRAWQEEHPELVVLDNPAKIVPVGMNIGIARAKGRWVARLDMHSEYPTDYLSLCLETSIRTDADNVGGVFVSAIRSDSFQARLVQAVTTHWFGVGNAQYRLAPKEGPADTVAFGFFRSEVFSRFGLYDERLVRNQDYELNKRILHSGGSIWLNPLIKFHYFNKATVSGLLKQAFWTSKWNAWMWYVAPYSFAVRHAIPGLFAVGAIGLIGLSPFNSTAARIGIVGLAAYMLVAVFVAFQHGRKFGWLIRAALAPAFLMYHLTYGSGMIIGLASLCLRRTPVQKHM